MVINVDLDNKFWSLRKRPIVLLTFFRTLLRCSSNVNLTSNVTPRCFWEEASKALLLLKTKDGCGSYPHFLANDIQKGKSKISSLKNPCYPPLLLILAFFLITCPKYFENVNVY